ncbi:hypothetical protein AB0J72_52430 [Dactylosporangium sp. NPDC049742]|uniref:hypothetical protein n=1 Tax=Dactylosporangium sp. NPDC049742 TaxID=3154737 RepID=UPI0034428531
MGQRLASAIDALYTTFSTVPKPTAIDGCPCCWLPAESEELLRPVPLRSLPTLAVAPYAAAVPFTAGSPDDFRYFLPRLLEVSVTDGFAGPDADFMGWPTIEPFLSRLRLTAWTTWDPAERSTVRAFLDAFWHDTLTTDPSAAAISAGDALCGIGNAEDDLTPYLDTWADLLPAPHPSAHLHDMRAQSYVNAFWDDRGPQHDQVTAWLEEIG